MTAKPLTVVALGGNAISPPRGDLSFATERAVIDRAVDELAELGRSSRLLVVHGNGPQVGRLLASPDVGDPEALDVHVAQTQGELGYLLAAALDARLERRSVAVLTRVLVRGDDEAFHNPTKPVGAVLDARPADAPAVRMADGSGWRRVVASPRPTAVLERDAIEALLERWNVVAGGGGGVALAGDENRRDPRPAVVDKDWVAALLAVELRAERLLFVTDVSHAFDRYGGEDQEPIHEMTVSEARERLTQKVFAPGSMAPKVESAVEFVEATDKSALIATVGEVGEALRRRSGTTIVPDRRSKTQHG